MGYNADVKKVMIASPGDVSQERRIIRDVIHEWNAIHAEDRRLVLMPIGWETNSSPAMGERPQAIINGQLLKQADLLVAVFWTRLGSPTGKADSGTVEEIKEHLNAGRPAMLYFSSMPVRLESVDPGQYESLKAFKDECKSKGLIGEYEDLTDFRSKLSRQLAQTVICAFARLDDPGRFEGLMEQRSVPGLSEAARELLFEAAADRDGTIMNLRMLAGRVIQTNGRGFVEAGDPRSEARWLSALKELEGLGLIEDRGYNEETFRVTDEGYRVADELRGKEQQSP